MSDAVERDFLTGKEAADFLRVSLQTVRNWTSARRMPVCKIGSRVLYQRSELAAMIERGRVPAIGEAAR
jgi:excisionase family DNA binding protein